MTEPTVFGNNIYCPECAKSGPFLSVARAAKCAGVSPKSIYRYIEAGKVHTMKVANSTYRVCAASLFVFEVEAHAPTDKVSVRAQRAGRP